MMHSFSTHLNIIYIICLNQFTAIYSLSGVLLFGVLLLICAMLSCIENIRIKNSYIILIPIFPSTIDNKPERKFTEKVLQVPLR